MPYRRDPQRVDSRDERLVVEQAEQRPVELEVGFVVRDHVVAQGCAIDLCGQRLQFRALARTESASSESSNRRHLEEQPQLGELVELGSVERYDAEPLVAHGFDQAFLDEVENGFAHGRSRYV